MKQVDSVLEAWLTQAIAAGKNYDPAAVFVGVASAITDNGAATVLADVTECTGALATRVGVVAWSAPYKLADGRWAVDGPICEFSPASSAEAQSVNGYFLASLAVAGTLKAFTVFGQAYYLPDETRVLHIVPRLTIDPLGRFGAEIVWNG